MTGSYSVPAKIKSVFVEYTKVKVLAITPKTDQETYYEFPEWTATVNSL